jgi:hypothetical protein
MYSRNMRACHQKKKREKRNGEKETLMHTAKVHMQTQTGSELPGLLICTKSATLTTHRTNTHTHTLIFQLKMIYSYLDQHIGSQNANPCALHQIKQSRNYFIPDLQCTSSQIHQRFQVWPLRSVLFVFTRSFEPLTHTL